MTSHKYQQFYHDHPLTFLHAAKKSACEQSSTVSSSMFCSYTGSITSTSSSYTSNYTHLPSPPFRAESDSDSELDHFYQSQPKSCVSPSLSVCTKTSTVNRTFASSASCVSPVDTPVSSSRVLEVPTHYLLFDLDGTLVNTTPAVEYFWRAWAVEYGLDGDEILKTSHGRRSLDVIKEQLPHRPDMHTQEYVNYMEKDIPYNLSHMALPIPGAQRLLKQIDEKCGALADNQWAICTSGSRGLASGWLNCFEWKEPIVFVTSDRCAKGKPHPYGYFTAAKTLEFHEKTGTVLSHYRPEKHKPVGNVGLDTPPSSPILTKNIGTFGNSNNNNNNDTQQMTRFLVPYEEDRDENLTLSVSASNKFSSVVFEDAPAGILAGKNSGAIVIGLATTYSPERVFEAGADYVVTDLCSISIKEYDAQSKQVVLQIHDPIYTPEDREKTKDAKAFS